MPKKLESLTGEEWNTLPRDKTLFVLDISGLEHHGPHLPVGMDALESRAIRTQVIEQVESQPDPWIIVELPSVCGTVSGNSGSPLKIEIRGHVIRDYLVDTVFSLWKNGFRYCAVFTGTLTPKHLATIEEASEMIRRRCLRSLPLKHRFFAKSRIPVFISASSTLVEREGLWRSPLWPDPIEHGGARDTSIGLLMAPDHVSELWKGLPPYSLPDSRWKRLSLRIRSQGPSYWGTPAQATQEHGERDIQRSVKKITAPLLQVLRGQAKPEQHFRSGYALFPTNRSLFTVWLMSLALIGIMTLWVLLNLKWMTEMGE